MASFRQWLSRWISSGDRGHLEAPPEREALPTTVGSDLLAGGEGGAYARVDPTLGIAESANDVPRHDVHLLERTRSQWESGDWNSLAQLSVEEVQQHGDRAYLALLVCAARGQLGDFRGQREWALMSREWGCAPHLMARVLVSGVCNTLGRAEAVFGRHDDAISYFERSIDDGPHGGDLSQLRLARARSQMWQLQASAGLSQNTLLPSEKFENTRPPEMIRWDWSSMTTLRSIHHLSCTGGTLIAKCLAAQPGVVVLNEIDPRSKLGLKPGAKPSFTPRDVISLMHQSAHLSDTEVIDDVFLAEMQALMRHTFSKGQALLLRDHTHSAYLYGDAPREGPTLRQTLRRRFSTHSVVTVRNPIDSYLSLRANGWLHFTPASFDEYCRRHLRFLADYTGVKWFRYEDFVADPRGVMLQMCEVLHIPFDEGFIQRFPDFSFSGDSGRKGDVVELRPRREFGEDFVAEVNGSSAFRELALVLGYPEKLLPPVSNTIELRLALESLLDFEPGGPSTSRK